MHNKISVENGFKIAIRHPTSGAAILAKTISRLIKEEGWINEEFKLKFCIMFVDNLIDGNIEKSINRSLLEKIKKKSFAEGATFLKRWPAEGMKYMLVIIMEELRHRQNFNEEQQYQFYEELLASFFPSHTVSDFIPKH
jgi:hypothetical protein